MAKRQSAFTKALREAQTGQPSEQQTIQTAGQPNIETARQPDSRTAKQQRIKATFYLNPDDIVAIDTMQTNHFRQKGKKPEKSEIVSEAIQLLFSQQNS